jgi:hypothetical protein
MKKQKKKKKKKRERERAESKSCQAKILFNLLFPALNRKTKTKTKANLVRYNQMSETIKSLTPNTQNPTQPNRISSSEC